MSGRVDVWQIAELKVFGEWKDFDIIKFGWLKFGEAQTIHQIRQTFQPSTIW